jgi:hypothetical protein
MGNFKGRRVEGRASFRGEFHRRSDAGGETTWGANEKKGPDRELDCEESGKKR